MPEESPRPPAPPECAKHDVAAWRIPAPDEPPQDDPCEVICEETVTLEIEAVGRFAMMCTPIDVEALAAGFAYSEGIISSAVDIVEVESSRSSPWTRLLRMRLASPPPAVNARNLIITSSCGLCGSRNIEELLIAGNVEKRLAVSTHTIVAMAEDMLNRQEIFRATGAAHAAAIFDRAGNILAFAEDIGRHNALDKVIGKLLLAGRSAEGLAAMLSGRVSFELVAKAAIAGIELIAAVSAPSSLAVDVAERCNMTLCGFVRGERITVYTHPDRITGGGQSE